MPVPPIAKALMECAAKHAPNSLETSAQIAANFASVATAVFAFVALFLISAKTLESQWNDSFRRLYDEFWSDEQIYEARKLISYDSHYDRVKDTLCRMARSSSITGGLTKSIKIKDSPGWRLSEIEGRYQKKEASSDKEAIAELGTASKLVFDEDDIKVTEYIDQFCSKCLQMAFTSEIPFFKKKQNEVRHLFFYYWIDAIEHREELKEYIVRFWPSFANQIILQKEKGKKR